MGIIVLCNICRRMLISLSKMHFARHHVYSIALFVKFQSVLLFTNYKNASICEAEISALSFLYRGRVKSFISLIKISMRTIFFMRAAVSFRFHCQNEGDEEVRFL